MIRFPTARTSVATAPAAFPPTAALVTAALVAALLLLASPAVGQEADAAQEREEFAEDIQVTEVLIDALVTDREGTVVQGLGKDDFTVREDGEEMDLLAATFYSARPTPTGAAGEDAAPQVTERFFIFVFQDARRLSPRLVNRQLDASRQVERWLREKRQPNDWVAVASYEASLIIQQDFTRELPPLLDAVERAALSKRPDRAQPDFDRMPPERPSLLRHLPDDRALRRRTGTLSRGMIHIGEASRHISGRKNLVFIGVGVEQIVDAGAQLDARYYLPMMRALNTGNVAVYPIEVLRPGQGNPLDLGLRRLAEDTSGRFYSSPVSFIGPIEQISETNTGYYLLAYRSTRPAGETGYQQVEVEVDQPGLRVQARQGYVYGQ